MSQAAPSGKVCVRCGQDCSDRPRVKDDQGRYCCKACLEKGSSHAPARSNPVDSGGDGQWDAGLGEAFDALDLEPVALPESNVKPCAGCGRPMQPGAVICVACGLNQVTGQSAGLTLLGAEDGQGAAAGASSRPVRVCSKCGYDLTGLKTPRCPECGTVSVKKRGIDLDREAAEKAYKWEYIKPLIILGVCGAIETAILFHNYRGMALLEATVIVLARVPVGIVAYLACAFAWLGFENTFKLTIVKLLGVFAAVSLATTVSLLIPFGFYRLSLSFFAQVWMLSDLMDMEYSDAAFVSAITSVVMIAAYFGVAYAFA